MSEETPVADRLRGYHAAGVITFREFDAMRLRFGPEQMSWTEIGVALRVSRATARERVARGLQKIREHERVAA